MYICLAFERKLEASDPAFAQSCHRGQSLQLCGEAIFHSNARWRVVCLLQACVSHSKNTIGTPLIAFASENRSEFALLVQGSDFRLRSFITFT